MKNLKHSSILLFSFLLTLSLINCKEGPKKKQPSELTHQEAKATIEKETYGSTRDNVQIDLFKLKNRKGMEVGIITYGGRITKLSVPDKNGNFKNVVLNFDSLEQYQIDNPFFGALIGRYGNRIANARFQLNDTEYKLSANDGPNSLHGGVIGFDKVVWKVEGTEETNTSASLKLSYLSADMEEGFPGNLKAIVTYTLNNDDSLDVLYEATTDKTTVVNLTQHSYFNLSGDFSTPILDHVLMLNADKLVPVDDKLIPTGELTEVKGTPFDFTSPKKIGNDIDSDNDQIKKGGGFDHCWVLKDQNMGMRSAAVLHDPKSGRVMNVLTDEPGIQFYTGNFLDGTLPSTTGGTYEKRSGLCLETQHYPDSPNHPQFPSVKLGPGEQYSTKTTFKFSTK